MKKLRTSRDFMGDRGSVAAMSAALAVALVLISGLVLDLSHLYILKLQSQRAADIATLYAAQTPNAIVNNTASELAQDTAQSIERMNGFPAALGSNTQATWFQPTLNLGLLTTLTTPMPLNFGGVLGQNGPVNVSATSVVTVAGQNATPCIYTTQISIAVEAGGSVTGPNCPIQTANAAAGYLDVCGNSAVNVEQVNLGLSNFLTLGEQFGVCADSTVTPSVASFNYNVTPPAPNYLAQSTQIQNAIGTVAAMGGAIAPASPFPLSLIPGIATGITAANTTINVPGPGTADPNCANPTKIGTVTLSGTDTLNFPAGCYYFSGTGITASAGTNASLQPVAGAQVLFEFGSGITAYAGASVSIGDGTKVFGALAGAAITNWGSITLGNGAVYVDNADSISNYGNFTVGNVGAAGFNMYGGFIFSGIGSNTSIGIGNVNMYGVGSITLNGTTTFGAGGSTATGAGAVNLANGDFALSSGNLTAVGVSFNIGGGAVNLDGSGTVNVQAPTAANPSYGEQDVAFALTNTIASTFNLDQIGGPQDTIGGAIYAPTAPMTFNTASVSAPTISPPAGGCLELYGSSVDINEDNLNIAQCTALDSSQAGTLTTSVVLAQ